MKEETALFFLRRYPVASLVNLALTFVNFTDQEATVIELCARKRMTQEAAAERLGVSKNSINTWYREALEKICIAWSGSEWIEILVENYKSKL